MSNKRHPNSEVCDFERTLHSLRSIWRDTHYAILNTPMPAHRRQHVAKQSCVDAFLRAAIAFEGFRSAWHITAIHRKPERFLASLDDQIRKQLRKDDSLRWVSSNVAFSLPRHPNLETTHSLVDPSRRNIRLSADGDASWRKRAERELSEPFRAKVVELSVGYWKLIEVIDALRNHLAHRSEGSRDRMNAALSSIHTSPLGISGTQRVQTDGVARYLWAYAGHSKALRLDVYYGLMLEFSSQLRVEAGTRAGKGA